MRYNWPLRQWFLLTAISTLINAMNDVRLHRGSILWSCNGVQEQPSHPHRNDFATRNSICFARRGRLIYLAIFTEALSAPPVSSAVTAAYRKAAACGTGTRCCRDLHPCPAVADRRPGSSCARFMAVQADSLGNREAGNDRCPRTAPEATPLRW